MGSHAVLPHEPGRLTTLTQRGLVRTEPDPHDARASIVRLTQAGTDLLGRAWQAMEDDDEPIERGVDVVTLARELDTLIRNAETWILRHRENLT